MSQSADDNTPVEFEHAGSTRLVRSGGRFLLEDALGTGPALKSGGREVAEGQFGTWRPIGAEQTTGGYLVAWKDDASGQYIVWRTDDAGNYLDNATGVVRGNDDGFRRFEDSFGQDLNDDSVIGAPHREVEHLGRTILTQNGSVYELDDSLGNGPHLRHGGNDVLEGQFGTWRPVSAEATAGGYLVAWKDDATSQFIVWRTDDKGNYLGNATGVLRGNDDSLRRYEDSFGHDLNDDSVLGAPHRELEHLGRTVLTQNGSVYELDDSLGNGPHLRHGGNDVLEGQFGTWRPIGAEKTTGGYLVAWKDDASGQYIVWRTDDAGNYLSNATSVVRGNDDGFRRFEDSFGQDLNDDSVIGAPHREVEHLGRTILTQNGSVYELDDSLGNGPTLKDGGHDVLEGSLGSWRPVSAEKTTGGYLVAWKDDASGQYIVWRTDDQGNKTGNATGVVRRSDDGLNRLEHEFGHDLNDDRIIGGDRREVEHGGSTALNQVGAHFELDDRLGNGPHLRHGGDDVLQGQFGGWRPISAEKADGGYLVAWTDDVSGQYIVWRTDDQGNYLSNASDVLRGDDDRFEHFEDSFHHDLNGDHHDGVWHG